MAVVVGVHGIAQQDSDPDRQWRLWSDSVRLGLMEARFPAELAPSLAVPFYGSLFRPGSEYLGPDDEVPLAQDEAAFVAAVFDEAAAGWTDEEITELVAAEEALGPPAVVPPWLLRGLAVVDRRWGRGSGWFLHRVLRQVYAYLYRDDAATEIRRIVQTDLGPDTRVLVGHSLGSVVAYDVLRRDVAPQVTTLITLGSPLPWATVRRALQAAAPTAEGLERVIWSNVYDPWDVVTAGKGLAPGAADYPVDNGHGDPHALRKYLGRQETARLIVDGAAPEEKI